MSVAAKRDGGPAAKRDGGPVAGPRSGDTVVMSLVRLVLELTGAIAVAMTLYLVLDSASTAAGRAFGWDPSLSSGALFLMLGAATVALCMPLLHTDSDARTRSFSSWTATVLVGFAVLRGLGVVSIAGPLGFVEHQVMAPLRHMLNL